MARSFTDDLFEAARPIWEAQLAHPFVRGIADGTLPEERFKNWVRQDYRYLIEFARVFAWAAAKADRLEAMSWYASALDLTLNTEMALHRDCAARFGISAEELERVPPWPTTRAYTDFLVRVAATGDFAELAAALLPCMWGFSEIGQALAARRLPAEPRYAKWVRMYADPEFAALAGWCRELVDRLAAGAGDATCRRMEEAFLTSSRYEYQFWEMAWLLETWPV
jgi:thiaminase/transcriptional activator TenA